MKQIFKLEIRRAFGSASFFFSIFLGMIIAFAQWYIEVLPFSKTLEGYMASGLPMAYPYGVYCNWMGSHNFAFAYLFFSLLPILATLPHGDSFYGDIKNNFISVICTRTKQINYYCSKYIAAFLAGGISVLVPLIFNFILCALSLPLVKPEAADYTSTIGANSTLGDLFYTHPFVYLLIFAAFIFLFSGAIATFSLLTTYYTHYRFIVLITPFLIYLFLNSFFSLIGLTDWQPVLCLNPGYNADRTIPLVLLPVIMISITSFYFILRGGHEDIY